MSLLLSHWYPGSCVVLDCIDSFALFLTLWSSTDFFQNELFPKLLSGAFSECHTVNQYSVGHDLGSTKVTARKSGKL